jgi:GPH family glycoside/pentoside/hexuronide:cation symporter
VLFLSLLIFASAAGIHAALNLHNYVFVWKLRPEVMQILTYANLFGITVAVPVTSLLLRVMEKKAVVALGFVLLASGWTILPSLRAAGVFMLTGGEALPWLTANGLLVGFGYGLIFIAYPSMMADAADEHEHLFRSRREGLYFSGLGFAGKAAAGVGTAVGGRALDLMDFPREVGRQAHAVVDESVLSSLALAWGPLPAALAVVGAVIFAPYAISRAKHEHILAALRRERAAAT